MDTKWKRYTSVGFTGLIAVIFFGLIWTFAAAEDPSWVFGESMLSDFGVSDTAAATYFNWGCFITGALAMMCGVGIASMRMRLYGVSGVAIAFMGLFLAFVGLFPSDTGDIHTFFAVGMFILGVLGMILMTVGDWIHGHVLFAGVNMLLLVVIIMTGLVESLAYFEAVAVIMLMIWIALSAVKMSLIKEKE